MKRDMPYAVVVGSLNCDTIYLQDRLPELGETYMSREALLASGGKGANQAAQISRLGMKTYMVGKVGPDIIGDYLREQLAQSGVDISHVAMGRAASGMAAIHTLRDGCVYATVAPGANMEVLPQDIEALRPLITGARILVLQMEIPRAATEYAFRMANRAGKPGNWNYIRGVLSNLMSEGIETVEQAEDASDDRASRL